MSINVYEYFVAKLGVKPGDGTLRELPLDSPCGDDCKKAIDLASAYLDKAREASSDSDVVDPLIESVDAVVQIFWRG